MARVAEWFECDEGYPTDASIERLAEAKLGWEEAKAFLLEDLPVIKEGISCMSVDYSDSERHGEPVRLIRFVTGGWSGAEDLIGAMLGNVMVRYHHTKWERGGLFEFEVPIRSLAPSPR